jgi:putative ABC transport system substrate-binding protein
MTGRREFIALLGSAAAAWPVAAHAQERMRHMGVLIGIANDQEGQRRLAAFPQGQSTEYQGMVDFHWSTTNLPDAERLAEALKAAARHPELVLLRIMSRVDSVDSISIKDERRTRH